MTPVTRHASQAPGARISDLGLTVNKQSSLQQYKNLHRILLFLKTSKNVKKQTASQNPDPYLSDQQSLF
ncbi:hypothetical protein PMI22_03220 [Pseudomonas sp. GM21]|nr:hypothetical protein PMI22_03220 [Pseudomonas sp. GM21]